MRELADVDWHRVLDDLVYLGMTGTPLSARLDASPALLRRFEAGERPSGVYAHRLVALWCHLVSKPAEFVPRRKPDAPGQATPGLASDEEHEPSFLALQAAFMAWGNAAR